MKKCSKCGETKAQLFATTSKYTCKSCRSEYAKAHNNTNKIIIAEKKRVAYEIKNKHKNKLTPNERNTLKYTVKLQEIFPHYSTVEYNGSKTPSTFHCSLHSINFIASPDGIIRTTPATKANKHCPECQAVAKTIIYKEELISLNLNVVVLGKYKDRKTQIKHICPQCNTDWMVAPKHIIIKDSTKLKCPTCTYSELSMTTQEDKYKDKETKLYYVEVNKGVFKLGLTQSSVKNRYRMDKDVLITPIREWIFNDGMIAYNLEQKLLKLFNHYHYMGKKLLVSGNTELFKENILEEIEPMIELTLLATQ